MMGVDDKGFHACRREMIQCKSDEGFPEDGDKRLGQIFRQRAKTQTKPGAENKGLCDHLPNEAPKTVIK